MANQYLRNCVCIPSSLLIVGATRSPSMIITVAEASYEQKNAYTTGMAIILRIPRAYGMQQANGLVGTIQAIDGADFYLDIDSSQFDIFTIPSGIKIVQPASIAPAGSKNFQFNNQSKNVAFQSLNNIGN